MKGLAAALALGMSIVTGPAQADTPSQWREIMLRALPKDVRSSGASGRVGFRASLDRNGQMANCEVTESSGHRVIDIYTCKFLTEHASFVAQGSLIGQQRRQITGFLNWPADKMSATATAGISTELGATTAAAEPLICKRFLKTGSLVRQSRTCNDEARMGPAAHAGTAGFRPCPGRRFLLRRGIGTMLSGA